MVNDKEKILFDRRCRASTTASFTSRTNLEKNTKYLKDHFTNSTVYIEVFKVGRERGDFITY